VLPVAPSSLKIEKAQIVTPTGLQTVEGNFSISLNNHENWRS